VPAKPALTSTSVDRRDGGQEAALAGDQSRLSSQSSSIPFSLPFLFAFSRLPLPTQFRRSISRRATYLTRDFERADSSIMKSASQVSSSSSSDVA
jgi:hypothetical protein